MLLKLCFERCLFDSNLQHLIVISPLESCWFQLFKITEVIQYLNVLKKDLGNQHRILMLKWDYVKTMFWESSFIVVMNSMQWAWFTESISTAARPAHVASVLGIEPGTSGLHITSDRLQRAIDIPAFPQLSHSFPVCVSIASRHGIGIQITRCMTRFHGLQA